MKAARGFTLVELLVVIAIIAILAVVGFAVFSGLQKGSRDAKRKEDVIALSRAYEANYANGQYPASPVPTYFSSGSIPIDPAGDPYSNTIANDKTWFKVCAALENNPSRTCYTASSTCVCITSAQGGNIGSGGYTGSPYIGPGGSNLIHPTCDTSQSLNNGLIGYWRMDESSWNGTLGEVKDSSSNNNGSAACYNGGSCTKPSTTTGKFGNAGSFNSTHQTAVNLGPNAAFNLTTDFTITAWVKRSGNCSFTTCPIFSKGMSSNTGYALELRTNNYLPTLNIRDSLQEVQGTTSVNTTNWYFIAASIDNLNIKVYTNGLQEASVTKNQTPNPVGQTGLIGNRNNGSIPFVGLIDDVRVYNRVLNLTEIGNLYSLGNGCIP